MKQVYLHIAAGENHTQNRVWISTKKEVRKQDEEETP